MNQVATTSRVQELQNSIIAGNIPQLVMNAIAHAIEMRSSDIHIEPSKNTIRMRYRVDGVLRRIVEYPHNIHPAVVSRVKIMSNLKIDEQRIPQDGRAHVTTEDNREMDLRVSTLPTINGEKIVMRIQEESKNIPTLEELGLESSSFANLRNALELPNGIILTTGPTGSGKTTTLYAALNILNKPEVNILTIEDPVEIQMDGLNQSQTHSEIDYTFASGLRTALRQDPDIIMVGEIRDEETVGTAIEASLTGHLVLSTIHTNSAVETITRILNMSVPPFLLTATINTIISQRLVRKLCQNCKQEIQIDPTTADMVNYSISTLSPNAAGDLPPERTFYGPTGCEQCGNIGYIGRVGLYELMTMSNPLRRMIIDRANTLDIQRVAMEEGMLTLEQSGIIKALKGLTSLEEVYRVARHIRVDGNDTTVAAPIAAPQTPSSETSPEQPSVQPEQPEPSQENN
ncbi:type II/IV secretion system protein [Candidatus Peregrinibacteria bacterium]|jgi:type II secretory ATPase GspE/PulE/Tfp pilus assembly ATPase PilB-like protein|nr:type II/IV secretion system protein [Candidatus Peregrinibacteria bacterium]